MTDSEDQQDITKSQLSAIPGSEADECADGEAHIATLVHLTDMHLFVTPEGYVRNQEDLRSIFRLRAMLRPLIWGLADKLVNGLEVHASPALEALAEVLPLLRAESDRSGVPLIAVHTGDADTIGPQLRGKSGVPPVFAAYLYLHGRLRPTLVSDKENWVDTYGNHDVWPGTIPFLDVLRHSKDLPPVLDSARHRANFDHIRNVEGLSDYSPRRYPTAIPGIELELLRLNTVHPSTLHNTLAIGRIGQHPILCSGDSVRDSLKELTTAVAGDQDATVIRVLLMHHPPHPFDTTWAQRLTTANLIGSEELGKQLGDSLRVHLIIAGHRHQLDPGTGATLLNGQAAKGSQSPLPPHTIQLVSESPTALPVLSDPDESYDSKLQRAGCNSFCVYRLFYNLDRMMLRVCRDRWAYSGDAGNSQTTAGAGHRGFTPDEGPSVVAYDVPVS